MRRLELARVIALVLVLLYSVEKPFYVSTISDLQRGQGLHMSAT